MLNAMCLVTDVFGHSYEMVISGRHYFAHTSYGKQKDFTDGESAKRFLRHLENVPDLFWRNVLFEASSFANSNAYTSDIDYESLAQLLISNKLKFYSLPSFREAPIAHNGAGRGYRFLAGPDLAPKSAKCLTLKSKADIDQLLNSLVIEKGYWSKVLNQADRLSQYQPSEYTAAIAELLESKLLRVYEFFYEPKKIEPAVEYEDVYIRKTPLALPPPVSHEPEFASEPESLDEVAKLLAKRREQIKSKGYQQKYSDDELRKIASTAEINDRYFVRLIFGNAEDVGGGTLGFKRDSGRAPYWATTLDMAEAADTDPEILAGLFGIENFDPEQDFCLAIIDMENMPVQAERESFIPTFKNMSKFGQKQFTEKEGFGSGTMSEIMNNDFAREYSEFMTDFSKTGASDFDSKIVKRHAIATVKDTEKVDLLSTRHKVQLEFGANPLFTGNGLTKVTPKNRYASDIGQKYGVVETFTFERDPLTISQLSQSGAVKIIPAKPING